MAEMVNLQHQALNAKHAQPAAVPTTSHPDFLKIVMLMKNLGTAHYRGGTDPFEANSWLHNLEGNFRATRCPDEFKKDVAVYYWEKDAMSWWLCVYRYIGDVTTTWPEFRQAFQRKYFPLEARDRLEDQFMALVQGDNSVRRYESEFTRHRQYVHYGQEDEPMIIRKFFRGFSPDIMSHIEAVEFGRFSDLVERAMNVEEAIITERASWSHSVEIGRQATQSQRPSPSMMNRGHRGRVVRGGHSGGHCQWLWSEGPYC
ncbi:uncharacterized protein LOC106391942 [Brassica napus]|uniref:uncharacterized protein LOC106391942 n=1 Tax=Brassica napus TaxID=3708 RepID=UPI00207A8249|nr:uncharacterized protein LOC106391942 [Brassica napus]XP_013688144.2 uncharacterized protein LOC106391942 [Brassica napus]